MLLWLSFWILALEILKLPRASLAEPSDWRPVYVIELLSARKQHKESEPMLVCVALAFKYSAKEVFQPGRQAGRQAGSQPASSSSSSSWQQQAAAAAAAAAAALACSAKKCLVVADSGARLAWGLGARARRWCCEGVVGRSNHGGWHESCRPGVMPGRSHASQESCQTRVSQESCQPDTMRKV